ncbi:hypothetical protein Tco_1473004, partial [Tanacetum coccineum]
MGCDENISPSASIGFVFLPLMDVALAAADSPVSILKLTSEDLSRNLKYVVPTGRVKVPAGRYVVPTSKDNVIVSAGRSKVIPVGRIILVLIVLCLLRVDSIIQPRKKTGRDPKGNIMILPPVSVEEHIA